MSFLIIILHFRSIIRILSDPFPFVCCDNEMNTVFGTCERAPNIQYYERKGNRYNRHNDLGFPQPHNIF